MKFFLILFGIFLIAIALMFGGIASVIKVVKRYLLSSK
ncbi:Protein of unknown function [Bacillus cytotoxicus]|uniref:Uncharacterized protein n=1 Tax=Bacillus cytotoxicus TaxID=580165 RepID=A0AAX2CF02_9BACI|nr:Protein of unknown function [Bacillus cytotoxicus]SCN32254.1 Protein of unknown function [Bacillus cytotoxicus]